MEPVVQSKPEQTVNNGWGFCLGRFQPFHDGHFALFDAILRKHPAGVVIAVRNTYGTTDKDPLSSMEVVARIHRKMFEEGVSMDKYKIVVLPDVQGVYYGRDVGWKVEQIDLPPEIQAISATQVRKEQGL